MKLYNVFYGDQKLNDSPLTYSEAEKIVKNYSLTFGVFPQIKKA